MTDMRRLSSAEPSTSVQRLHWEMLPESVRDAVEQETGPIIKAESVPGARSGLACRVYAEDTDLFLKAIQQTDQALAWYQRELLAATRLPASAPAPELLWSQHLDGWLVLAFELINDRARHVDLRPGSPDLPAVIDTLTQLSQLSVATASGRPVAEYVSRLWAKGRHPLGPDAELEARDLYEAALERFDLEALSGNTLLHGNLGSRSLLIKNGRVYAVGWSEACFGLPWIDAALLAPRLIAKGHSAEQTGALLSAVPAWLDAPAVQVAGLTALWTLAHLFQVQKGPEMRQETELQLATAGREWLAYRLSKL